MRARFEVDRPVTYLITVANSVVVTDVLPPRMTLISAVPAVGSCGGATTITCSLGSIAPGTAGVGIAGINERVRELGGELSIHSDDSGTTVRVTLPSTAIADRALSRMRGEGMV